MTNSIQAVANTYGSAPRAFVQLRDSGVFHLIHQDGSNYVAGSGLHTGGSGVVRPAAFEYYAIYGGALWKMTGDQGSFAKTQLAPSGFHSPGGSNITYSKRQNLIHAGDGTNVVTVNKTNGAKTVLFPLATPYL